MVPSWKAGSRRINIDNGPYFHHYFGTLNLGREVVGTPFLIFFYKSELISVGEKSVEFIHTSVCPRSSQ